MILTETQESLLERATSANLELIQARISEREVADRQYQARIQGRIDRRNRLLAEAATAGIPISQIGKRALGTSNFTTAKSAIEAGHLLKDVVLAQDAEESEGPLAAGRYSVDRATGLLKVTLQGEDFEPYAALLVREPDAEGESWEFCIGPSGALLPVKDAYDSTWENPVVAVVMTEAMRAEALAFLERHTI